MARDTTDARPIESTSQMVEWFEQGCKPEKDWRIGTEHEKFGFYVGDHSPVPYEGERGIGAILTAMQEKLGWDPIMDAGNIIGLAEQSGMGAISIEPGGQFELSGAPLEHIHETCNEINQHLKLVKEIARDMEIGFLGLGGSPVWTLEETPAMPKSRYKIMTNYMPKVGSKGLNMMYRTCTIQVNLDFSSEADMRRKMNVSLKLQPLATALFANSPFRDGKLTEFLSWRADVWTDTDNKRGGYHPFMLEDAFGFEQYANWCIDLPMYFIIRDGKYVDCTHITFRQFMDGALKGEVDEPEPTMGDWTNHISTAFPDVRLKRFLEMRGADGGPWHRICALPALWVGLLYSASALDEAEALVKDWSADMVGKLRDDVPRLGLKAGIGGRSLQAVAKDVLAICARGLKDRNFTNSDGLDETLFLNTLEDIVYSGKTPAEQMLADYHGKWQGDIGKVFEDYAY